MAGEQPLAAEVEARRLAQAHLLVLEGEGGHALPLADQLREGRVGRGELAGVLGEGRAGLLHLDLLFEELGGAGGDEEGREQGGGKGAHDLGWLKARGSARGRRSPDEAGGDS